MISYKFLKISLLLKTQNKILAKYWKTKWEGRFFFFEKNLGFHSMLLLILSRMMVFSSLQRHKVVSYSYSLRKFLFGVFSSKGRVQNSACTRQVFYRFSLVQQSRMIFEKQTKKGGSFLLIKCIKKWSQSNNAIGSIFIFQLNPITRFSHCRIKKNYRTKI